jgi:crotonobetainyl-CoA:carnitine CoA-transferase CaiB-like acyl-CoA transferase
VDSMTRFMSPRIVPYLGSGVVPARTGAKDSVIAVYQVFHAADAPMNLALGNDALAPILERGGPTFDCRGSALCH